MTRHIRARSSQSSSGFSSFIKMLSSLSVRSSREHKSSLMRSSSKSAAMSPRLSTWVSTAFLSFCLSAISTSLSPSAFTSAGSIFTPGVRLKLASDILAPTPVDGGLPLRQWKRTTAFSLNSDRDTASLSRYARTRMAPVATSLDCFFRNLKHFFCVR